MTAGTFDLALCAIVLTPMALTLAYVVRDIITKGKT